ncbi:hypothetical protein KC340_g7734 [Hortaea werneckii]|nr:hypothetical protein KC342_g6190 [Hortaea werneckii]KAI7099318.1 hypothetical protein KC339_g8307 [Hortaea werneckii]KAI7237290.1 hypothetical protein KC365_g4838 [Hortaea werneckii]KAI7319960.1 hypothetical protein KC340_g7734 [Hortaea werneckii]KAI7388932.1 hypothetical protein KC328_g8698 [Hortaea werneckii]
MAPMMLIDLNPLGPLYIPEWRKSNPKPPKPKFPPTPLNQTELIRCITAHDCDVTKRSLDIGNDTISVSHKWGESTVTVGVAPQPDDTLEKVYGILESGRLAAEKNLTASSPFLGNAAEIPSVPTVAQPNAPFGMIALFGLFSLMALMTLVASYLVFDDLRARGATKRRIDDAEAAARMTKLALEGMDEKLNVLSGTMDGRLTKLSSEMDGLRVERDTLQEQRDQQERTIAQLVASKQLLETETAQLSARLGAVDCLEGSLKASQAKADELDQEYTEAAEELTKSVWRNEALEEEVRGLQKQLKAEQEKGEGASEELARALQENEELKKQLEDERAKSQAQADETSTASEDPVDLTSPPSGAEGLQASRWASEAGPSTASPEKTAAAAAETTLNKNQRQRERDHQRAVEWANQNPDQVPPHVDRFRRGNNARAQKALKAQQIEVKRMIKEGLWQPNEEWKAWLQTEQGIKGMKDME